MNERHGSRRRWAAPLVLVVLGTAACGSTGAQTAPTSTPVVSSSAPSASSSASPTPSATASTSATPSPTPVARTSAELRKALLSLKDVPAGFEVDKSGDSDGGVTVSSSDAGCAALVRLLRTTKLPGSLAEAGISFTGGSQGPEVSEDLDALGSKQAAAAFIQGYRASVRSCRTVTVKVPGAGSSVMEVREISFGKLGDDTFAARLRARSGALEGLELIQVGVQSGDVVLGMNTIGLEGPDAETATSDAVKKATRVLGTGDSI